MSISTYAELQTAVENWLDHHGTEFTARIPEFIAMAEGRINRLIRVRELEQLSTLTYGAGNTTRRVALPSAITEILSMQVKLGSAADSDYRRMSQIAPGSFHEFVTTAGGYPERFCLRDQIEMDRLVGVDYTLRLHYIKKLDLATDLSNWVLTNYPDIYLYASLIEAGPFIGKVDNMAFWQSRMNTAIDEANRRSDRSRDDVELDLGREYSGTRYDITGDA